ncbi:MAG: hypothetical protein ACRC3B_21760, partial [Bacteroidia bacterium]
MDNYSIFDTFDDGQEKFRSGDDQTQPENLASEAAAEANSDALQNTGDTASFTWDISSTSAYAEEPEMNWDGILAAEQGTVAETFADAEAVEVPEIADDTTNFQTVESFNENEVEAAVIAETESEVIAETITADTELSSTAQEEIIGVII